MTTACPSNKQEDVFVVLNNQQFQEARSYTHVHWAFKFCPTEQWQLPNCGDKQHLTVIAVTLGGGLAAGQWQPGDEASTKAGAAEHMLLGALIELYHDARENDVRLGILRITLQSLQRHGKYSLLSSNQHHSALIACAFHF